MSMTVMRFPNRRSAAQFVEHEPDDDGASFDPFAAGEDGPYTDEPPLPETPRRNARAAPPPRQPRAGQRAPTPLEILAGALHPSDSAARPATNPAAVIAQSLYPSLHGATQELLRQSFWQVWLQHRDYLKKKSYFFLDRRRDDAEDALSTTMLKAMHNFVESAGDIENTRAWLTTILHNACMDGHRHAKRRRDLIADTEVSELENLPHSEGSHARTPEDIVRIRQSLDALHRQILALPEVLREPLLLRTVEHLSYTEIAQRLGLTEANTRKRVQQARDQLRAGRGYDSLAELFGTPPTDY
jgi:RNA polymerase sigma-70 factor (ECF subfamily)